MLAVVGGTLIDGNGGAPLPDAVVVMEGGRFRAVGRRAEIPLPAGTPVIDATAKVPRTSPEVAVAGLVKSAATNPVVLSWLMPAQQ